MSRPTPKLSEDASEQARAVHAYLVAHRLSMRGWAARAGLSRNVLVELFSGRTRSLNHASLTKLAAVEQVGVREIAGDAAGIEMVDIKAVQKAVTAWAIARGELRPEVIAQEIIDLLESG